MKMCFVLTANIGIDSFPWGVILKSQTALSSENVQVFPLLFSLGSAQADALYFYITRLV